MSDPQSKTCDLPTGLSLFLLASPTTSVEQKLEELGKALPDYPRW